MNKDTAIDLLEDIMTGAGTVFEVSPELSEAADLAIQALGENAPERILEMRERNKVKKMYKPNPGIYCCPCCGQHVADNQNYNSRTEKVVINFDITDDNVLVLTLTDGTTREVDLTKLIYGCRAFSGVGKTGGRKKVKTNITKKEKVMRILSAEEKDIRNMKPDEDENEVSYDVRKVHYLAELRAIRTRIYNELN